MSKEKEVIQDAIYRYTDRTSKEVGKRTYVVETSPKSAIRCIERFKRRSGNTVSPNSTNTYDAQTESFEFALNNSMNSERVLFLDGEDPEKEMLSIITPNDKEGKNIASPLFSDLDIGQTIEWVRHDTKWLCISLDPAPKGFLRGNIIEAKWRFRWSDDKGNTYFRWAAIKGPVETKYKNENLGDFLAGKPNDTLEIRIGALDKDVETLKRYKRISAGGRIWKIAVIDDISEPKIVSIHCIENYENAEEDENMDDIPVIEDDFDYDLLTNFDFSTEITPGVYPLEAAFYNGDNLLETPTIKVEFRPEDVATYDGNSIVISALGALEIIFKVDGYPYSKRLKMDVVEAVAETDSGVEIIGDLDIYHGQDNTYYVRKYENGQAVPIRGEWILQGAKAQIVDKTADSITIEPDASSGTIMLIFIEEETFQNYMVEINITSLFGKS